MTSKEPTPVTSDAAPSASPIKKDDTATETKPLLNAREEELFKVAMIHCLKSGPPEIDYHKFVKYGNFNTLKTAQNTWSKIKNKLPKPEVTEDGDGAIPKTPSKKATPKKRGKQASTEDAAEEEGGVLEPPKKRARKTPVKKVAKAEESEESEVKAEGGE